jgi:hypothetical protein
VEVDQNASGMVFLALFLRNKALAKKCNLINDTPEKPDDIYTYVSEHVKDFLVGSTYTLKKKSYYLR